MGRHGGGERTGPSSQIAEGGRGPAKGPASGKGGMAPTGRGNYPAPSIALGKSDLIKGLKGIKLKHPNRHLTTNAYKTGLKKADPAGEGAGG